uniref:exodeoxyribonuclease III n=1 Tax=Neolamprologus brichardi TaxID=32507 RepID=A0A3Q4GV44_NEOBR
MRNITLVSMNVNGMNNPIKRSKVILKMRKLNANAIYLQETHLSQEDKLKKFGYRNSYYSTSKKSRKREVAILIKNSVNFECSREIRDSEGRYIIVRGKLEGEAVTLINLYIPPESNQQNVKTLLTTVMSESEGTVLCAGDFNVVFDHRIDTTRTNRSKNSLRLKISLN